MPASAPSASRARPAAGVRLWSPASERMGHDVPGMAGVYGHIMPRWRQRLRAQLQELWDASLTARARLDDRSAVGVLDGLLAPYRISGQHLRANAQTPALQRFLVR